MRKSIRGFTIVELLVVVVVIAILAAITIVAYNGIQVRSNISSINSGLSQLNKTILAYKTIHDTYPDTGGAWSSQYAATQNTFIPSVVPEIVSSLPYSTSMPQNPRWYYRSNGVDYKLLFLYPSTATIPSDIANNSAVASMIDPVRPTRGWGYWTSGGASY